LNNLLQDGEAARGAPAVRLDPGLLAGAAATAEGAPPAVGPEAMPWRPLLVILLVLLVGAVAIVGPRLVSPALLAALVQSRLCPELGIECRIDGPISARLLPFPAIEASAVHISVPQRKVVVSADRIFAELRALPLLAGRISVNHLELSHAVIGIAAPPGGMRLFTTAEGAGNALVDAILAAHRQGYRLTRVSLDRSRVTLGSESGKHDVVLEAVSGWAAWPQAGGPLFAQATGSLAGQAFSLRAEGPDLEDLKRAGGSPTFIHIGFGANWLTYRGRLVKAPDIVVAGALEAMLPSAKRAAQSLRGLKWPAWLPDVTLHVVGQAFATARGVNFENTEFIIGRSRFSGGLSLRMTPDGRPSFSGTVAAASIEFADLSSLRLEQMSLPSFGRLPDLDLRMSARRVLLGGNSLEGVAAGLILADRRLALSLSFASVDDSGAKLRLVATPDEDGIALKLQASSEKLDIASFLSGLSIPSGLAGIGSFAFSFEGRSEDLARLVHSLSGKASLLMRKGALSVAESLLTPASDTGSAAVEAMSRKFSEASFAGVAERGVLALTEGRLGEGAGRINVGGSLDLAARRLDLLLGAGGEGTGEAPWRLRLTGPWSAPTLGRGPLSEK